MSELKNDTLYIDLNSCFATIEQQSRPMLRGRPVAVTNRLVPNSCIIAASYEAKSIRLDVRAPCLPARKRGDRSRTWHPIRPSPS